jgi:DNA-binding CsgD family transcriptional regulator
MVRLTPRDRDILVYVALGLSNKEIAQKLFISEYSAKEYVQRLRIKLNAPNKASLAAYAGFRHLPDEKELKEMWQN